MHSVIPTDGASPAGGLRPSISPAGGRGQDLQTVLFLAQLPPPVHGVTNMSAQVMRILTVTLGLSVEHLWLGGARSLADVGRKSAGKIAGFGQLLARLGWRWITGRRYAITYQTLAPHGQAALRDALVILLSKRLTPRALVHLHTQGLDDILTGGGARNGFIRWALRCTELIAISEHVARLAEAHGEFSAIHALPNLVHDPGPPLPRCGERLRCGFLGNFDARKGVLRFVDIVSGLKARGVAVEGFIAGGPTRQLGADDIERYVAAAGLAGAIDVLGFVSEEEKARQLSTLDVFIYPTEHDLAPLVVLEAMAHGAVPVVYDTGGLREMVGPSFAANVIAPARSERERVAMAVDATVRAVSEGDALRAGQVAARAHYEANYTPDVYAIRLAAIVRGRRTAETAVSVVVGAA